MKLNQGRYQYPGVISMTEGPGNEWKERYWDKATLREYLQPVVEWQKRHGISSNRILAGEFGCNRIVRGCKQYLSDLIDIFAQQGWNWSFYAFREDTWPGMDYELGTRRLTEAEWNQLERCETLEYPDQPSSIASVLRQKLRQLK